MNLDGGLRKAFVDQERGDLQSLVALELDNLASLLIINEGTVAGKFLHGGEVENERQRHGLSWVPSRGEATVERRLAFLNAFKSFLRSYSAEKGADQNSEIARLTVWWWRTFREALQCGQGLAAVPLLDTDVDVVLLGSNVLGVVKRVSLVCEGICIARR